ncbi:MAG: thioredoxin family protein [Verrucomicrobia bacterium]|nr:thioredoxin family protein [Verrucomicrobiota bacterium]MBS0645065.1 thioredoxin family protein [Verrucomicrobiota bacterium]
MKLRTLLCATTIILTPAMLMADAAPSQGSVMSDQSTGTTSSPGSNGTSSANSAPAPSATSAPAASATSSTQAITWITDYRAGLQQAQQNHKPIFLYFTGSDWCGWCKKLDQEVFSQPDFAKSVGDKFVFVKLDFPMNRSGSDAQVQQNTQLKQQYGVTGFPTVVLLDAKGNFIAETGYRSGGARSYASYIEQLMGSSQS